MDKVKSTPAQALVKNVKAVKALEAKNVSLKAKLGELEKETEGHRGASAENEVLRNRVDKLEVLVTDLSSPTPTSSCFDFRWRILFYLGGCLSLLIGLKAVFDSSEKLAWISYCFLIPCSSCFGACSLGKCAEMRRLLARSCRPFLTPRTPPILPDVISLVAGNPKKFKASAREKAVVLLCAAHLPAQYLVTGSAFVAFDDEGTQAMGRGLRLIGALFTLLIPPMFYRSIGLLSALSEAQLKEGVTAAFLGFLYAIGSALYIRYDEPEKTRA